MENMALLMSFIVGMLLLHDGFGSEVKNELHSHKDVCTPFLHLLAEYQMHYLHCSTMNAVPVKLCMGCVAEYSKMQTAFNNLTSNATCVKKFFDHDRINVVLTTQNMLVDLWQKAHCDDCRSHSSAFQNKTDDLQNCFKEEKTNANKCAGCLPQYKDLNDFYKSIDQKNQGQVCFDLQDAMNQTRVYWSKELKCSQRQFHMTYFLILTIGFGSLPIVFYAGAYILTRRRERNHAVLHIEQNVTSSTRPIANLSSRMQPEQNLPEPPNQDTAILKKNMKIMNESGTDSDDELIPKMQKLT